MRSVLQSLFLICLGAALALAMVVLYQGAGGAHPGSQGADLRVLQDHFRKLSSSLAPSVVAVQTRSPKVAPGEYDGCGSGFAFGYLGGVLALAIMLALFAENSATGKTLDRKSVV